MLRGKKILIGITGGIAAYKIPLLVREFKKQGAAVKVVMTKAATEFINPNTLAALSENEIVTDTFPDASLSVVKSETWHIHLGTWADIMLIAPATANTIAKIAYGIADNPVTIMALSVRCPVAVSPAMDTYMWENPATQENLTKLRQRGYKIINPEVGELASGLTGKGRLPELKKLVNSIQNILDRTDQDFSGKSILVTAGPTYEPIDPVRYIGNRSSGKMGFAIARCAAERGAKVTLITGPSNLETPNFVKRVEIETAEDMYKRCIRYASKSDVVIMAAAVADFKPEIEATRKIKKDDIASNNLTLKLTKTKDILDALGKKKKKHQVLIGFALETDNEIENAVKKLNRKNLDFIVMNNPLKKGAEIGGSTNIVSFIHKNGRKEIFNKMLKNDVANQILNRVSKLNKR